MNASVRPRNYSSVAPSDMVERLYPAWGNDALVEYKEKVLKEQSRPFVAVCNNIFISTIAIGATLSLCGVLLVQFICQKLLRDRVAFFPKKERQDALFDGIGDFIERYWMPRISWQRSALDSGSMEYRHGYNMVKIPSFAEEAVRTAQGLVPYARFDVLYCGVDPILVCIMEEERGARFSHEKRHTLCVWDFHPDGSAYVVEPPSRMR